MYVSQLDAAHSDSEDIERQMAKLSEHPPAWVLMYGSR